MARFISRMKVLSRYLPAFFRLTLEDGGEILLEDGSGHLIQE